MSRGYAFRSVWIGVLAVCALTWIWRVTAGEQPVGATAKRTRATSEELGGAERCLTFVTTDKPIYRRGENVCVRVVVLQHLNHKPLSEHHEAAPEFAVIGPTGETVAAGMQITSDSIAGFQWLVPAEQPGGEYTAKVTYSGQGHAPAERKFEVREYRVPRLKSQIKFLRDGYGPSDVVVGTLHVERAEGGFPVGAKVTVVGRVDGVEVSRNSTTVDTAGNALARFALPAEIRRGEGTLAMIIEDGGVVETASKTIPILLQTVDLSLFPEGGELVAGLPNRVYFEALTPAKKPADLAGIVIDAAGSEVAKFRSEHEGRGRFEFTPTTGQSYSLRITEPSGIKTKFDLPRVQSAGAVIQTANNVFAANEPVVVNVALVGSSQNVSAARPFNVTLAKCEAEIGKVTIAEPTSGLNAVTFSPPDWADGVLVATVWDQDGNPRAERLVYRQPARGISVEVTANAKAYTPGGKAGLKVVTKDENGKPISAVVGLSVVDDSVLEMIEKREQRPLLPVQVLLEGDVKELADAHVYLDPKNPQAELAVDRLLGTQGWRRFAFVNVKEFVAQHGDAARRVTALRQMVPRRAKSGFLGGGGRDAAGGGPRGNNPVVQLGMAQVERADALPAKALAPSPIAVKPVDANLLDEQHY